MSQLPVLLVESCPPELPPPEVELWGPPSARPIKALLISWATCIDRERKYSNSI